MDLNRCEKCIDHFGRNSCVANVKKFVAKRYVQVDNKMYEELSKIMDRLYLIGQV